MRPPYTTRAIIRPTPHGPRVTLQCMRCGNRLVWPYAVHVPGVCGCDRRDLVKPEVLDTFLRTHWKDHPHAPPSRRKV